MLNKKTILQTKHIGNFTLSYNKNDIVLWLDGSQFARVDIDYKSKPTIGAAIATVQTFIGYLPLSHQILAKNFISTFKFWLQVQTPQVQKTINKAIMQTHTDECGVLCL